MSKLYLQPCNVTALELLGVGVPQYHLFRCHLLRLAPLWSAGGTVLSYEHMFHLSEIVQDNHPFTMRDTYSWCFLAA